jgi:hypothetical protein
VCIAIRVPQFEHFLGKALRPGQSGDFSSSPGSSKLFAARGTDAESRRASKGSVHANIDLPRPQAFGRRLVRVPNAKSNGDKLPRTWNTGTSTVLGTTKSQQFRNIVLAAGAVSVKSYARTGFDPRSIECGGMKALK